MAEAKSLLPGYSERLAKVLAALRYEALPGEAVARARLCVLDGIGCAVFGATLPWTRIVAEMVRAEGGRAEASLMGFAGEKVTASQAALVNGTAGHAYELDDIHKDSILHANSLAFPAALALAEVASAEGRPIDGRRFIAALVAGYEAGCRIGAAAGQPLFFRGFHPQGVNGVFASAAAAAHIMGLDAEGMLHAIGLAGSQAAGLMAAQEGAMAKRLHSGKAAQAGIYAARLAARGFTGIRDVVEAGYGGFLSSFTEKPDIARLTEGLGERWEILQVGFKPHASVTSIHTALDALSAIMKAQGLKAADIEAIDAGISPMTYTHCAWPYRPEGVTAAQMNLYFGLAVMALDGAAFVQQYAQARLKDPAVLELIGRCTAHVEHEIAAKGPAARHACRLTVRTRDGRSFTHEEWHRRGSPENPVTAAELDTKFRRLVAGALPAERIAAVIAAVAELEQAPDAAALAPLTRL